MFRKRKKDDAGLGVVLPITPMLDMMFQLFAFFLITFNPQEGLQEGYMDFNLPAAGEYKRQEDNDVEPTTSDTEIKIETELTVIVKTPRDDAKGAISSIEVQSPQASTSVENLQKLGEYLAKARKGLTNQDDIKIQADSKLKYAYVIEVMDTCIKSGFQRVGFAPPPDAGTSG